MKKILAWPTPLLQKWLLSLLLCLPFLAAAIISAFSGDRTFLILSALLLLFCGVRCAELYVMLANERYCAEEGTCLSVSSIPFQRQRRVILQKSDGFFRGRRRGGEQISGGLRRKNRDIYGLRDGEAAAKN